MKIETYEDGNLVDSKSPNWSKFNTAFLANQGYNAVVATTSNQRAVTRIESMAIAGVENFQLFMALWGAVIAAIPSPPSAKNVEEWNAIASSAFMPFVFAADGKMNSKAS